MSNFQWQQIFGKVSMGLCKSIQKKPDFFYTGEYKLIYNDCLQDIHNETITDSLRKIYCCKDDLTDEKNDVYIYHEYCCTWSNLMNQYKNSLLFLTLLILGNTLILAGSIISNCYLIWVSIKQSEDDVYNGFNRKAFRSKPRFPSFGNITEILRSKNPMVRLKLEFDVDNIETTIDWKLANDRFTPMQNSCVSSITKSELSD
ncbi:hypothetical protein DERP_002084 [Dermatophagoides pteronyssinus]|uniref:Uncharacterized protein n=1 Tax=Dermatophagoides pteronyssinus TaxID=6956 RepID=A0ABQ8JHJ2_DERPT|nr:hypothetical protein DERP_002084 [Dermatophagoides pteronyssinus]